MESPFNADIGYRFRLKNPDLQEYDEGDVGKEPMIRVLGRNALNVVEKVRMILDLVAGSG